MSKVINNSIPAGVENSMAKKLTASYCFVCQATPKALTANKAETCWSASTKL